LELERFFKMLQEMQISKTAFANKAKRQKEEAMHIEDTQRLVRISPSRAR